MRVVIDENLPRSFGGIFEKRGFEIFDIRDHGLRGAKDSAVFSFVKQRNAAIATSDKVFANNIHLFEAEHRGVFLIRLPTFLSVETRCQELDRALEQFGGRILDNRLVVIGVGTSRIHDRHP